jgi:hypothetical protein
MPPTISNVASEKRELGRVRNNQMRVIRFFEGSGLLGALIAIPDDSSDQQAQPIGDLKCLHPIPGQPAKCVD